MPAARTVPETLVRHIRQHKFQRGDVRLFARMYDLSTTTVIRIRDGLIYKDVE